MLLCGADRLVGPLPAGRVTVGDRLASRGERRRQVSSIIWGGTAFRKGLGLRNRGRLQRTREKPRASVQWVRPVVSALVRGGLHVDAALIERVLELADET